MLQQYDSQNVVSYIKTFVRTEETKKPKHQIKGICWGQEKLFVLSNYQEISERIALIKEIK